MLIKHPAYVTEGSKKKLQRRTSGGWGRSRGKRKRRRPTWGKRNDGVRRRHCVKNKNTCIKKRTSILFLLKLPHNDNQACPGSERVWRRGRALRWWDVRSAGARGFAASMGHLEGKRKTGSIVFARPEKRKEKRTNERKERSSVYASRHGYPR